MKKILPIISLLWLALVGLSYAWNVHEARIKRHEIALQTAKSFFDQIVLTRLWNTGHGGVYVPVSEHTKPNQYLEDPLRDIVVNHGLTLTKINPAFMTRQIAEIARSHNGVKFHLTSLSPLRPENHPTPRESIALQEFEKGSLEVGEFITENAKDSFFYMAPLFTEKACLQCHGKYGFKEGDIRGGLSVTLPYLAPVSSKVLQQAHLGIATTGLLLIWIFGIKLNQAYQTIKMQAALDALTKIPNRRSFSEQHLKEFHRSKRDQCPLSLIMCDVDNFKLYNDTYGHKKGDECLVAVAQAIGRTISRPGDFCARYGGEEFVAILPSTPREGAVHLAEKIRKNIEKLHIPHERALPEQIVTISLGVATVDTITEISHEQLVEQADKALYMAKDQGRNCVAVYREQA